MPLVRYELQSEYKLADSELLRCGPFDDPNAIFEGVAMAGMVGFVRQLGSLVEFAAELFHDLHHEVTAAAARGRDLFLRVQHLEAKLTAFEKPSLSGSNQRSSANHRGVKWRARVCVRQNHWSERDLPQFVRSSYEKCRDPPKFSPFDRYDNGVAGAAQKRYSDPSFFKTKWVNSELKRAARIREDEKARRMKVTTKQ